MASDSKLAKSVETLESFLRDVREDLSRLSCGDLENALKDVKLDLEAKDELQASTAAIAVVSSLKLLLAFKGINRLLLLHTGSVVYHLIQKRWPAVGKSLLVVLNDLLQSFTAMQSVAGLDHAFISAYPLI